MTDLTHVNDKDFESEVLKSEKPVLLDFGATWCGPCKHLEPTIAALASEYGDRVLVRKLDLEEAPETAQRFGVLSVPTIVFLKGGREVHRFSGIQTKDKIASLIQNHLLNG